MGGMSYLLRVIAVFGVVLLVASGTQAVDVWNFANDMGEQAREAVEDLEISGDGHLDEDRSLDPVDEAGPDENVIFAAPVKPRLDGSTSFAATLAEAPGALAFVDEARPGAQEGSASISESEAETEPEEEELDE